MRKFTPFALLLALVAAVLMVVPSLGAAPAAPSACVYPTGTITQAKSLAYNRCRFDELSAQIAGLTPGAPAPSPTPTPTASPTPTPTPTSSPTPTPTSSPTPTPTQPTATGFPTAATAGVPAGWTPKTTRTGDYTITTAGAVIEDLRVTNGNILVRAPNVTLRRVELLGGIIHNEGNNGCLNGLVIEDTSIGRAPGQTTRDSDWSVVMVGGYTARNVKITGLPEGFRVGGDSVGCGPVVIEDSYAEIVRPDVCGDWHGDGLQGYDGPALTVRNTVLKLDVTQGCGATSPYFYPSGQGNTSATIDGLVVDGGGFPFRQGTPGSVKGLHIVDGSWVYGPISVACNLLSTWQASVSTINAAGQPVVVRSQPCNTTDGS
jgi:hypothetical protein